MCVYNKATSQQNMIHIHYTYIVQNNIMCAYIYDKQNIYIASDNMKAQ